MYTKTCAPVTILILIAQYSEGGGEGRGWYFLCQVKGTSFTPHTHSIVQAPRAEASLAASRLRSQKGSRGARVTRSAGTSRMPSSRRTMFKPPRRRSGAAQSSTTVEDADVEMGIVQDGEVEADERLTDRLDLEQIASDLWSADYTNVFKVELEHNRALGIRYGTFGVTGQQLQLSSYARRLSGHRREAWEHRQLVRERDQLAIALHAANMRHWSHSLVARSIAYFTLTTTWQHQVESGQRSPRFASSCTAQGAGSSRHRHPKRCQPRSSHHPQ